MAGLQWEQSIDETKDYYGTLGVTSNATQDELKTAYVQLALLHHPDTAPETLPDQKAKSEAFINISEAWGILSRPEIRLRYDSLRSRYLGLDGAYGSMRMSDAAQFAHAGIPVGYDAQKMNYGRLQRKVGATMEDTSERTRRERWQNTPLNEKKIRRAQPLSSMGVGLKVVPVVLVAGVLVYAFYSSRQKKG